VEGNSLLWLVFAIVALLWILGFGFHVAGNLIHLLLVIALGISFFKFFSGRHQVQ
jgi:hypothetical protein